MKETSSLTSRIAVRVGIAFLILLGLILSLVSAVLRFPAKFGSSQWPILIAAIPFAVALIVLALKFGHIVRVRGAWIAIGFLGLSAALVTYDLLVTSRNSAIMLTDSISTKYYALQPPSEFRLVEKHEDKLVFSAENGRATALLTVAKPLSHASNSRDINAYFQAFTSGGFFDSCCRLRTSPEIGMLNGYPTISADYEVRCSQEKVCRFSIIKGAENVHLLEYCAPSDVFSEKNSRFNLLRASITKVQ